MIQIKRCLYNYSTLQSNNITVTDKLLAQPFAPSTRVSSHRQLGSTTDFLLYLVGFLIHLLPYFRNCFCFPICRNKNHVCKILTLRDPLIVKNLKIFSNVVFDSLNWAFWDTEQNAKKYSPLQSTVLEKTARNWSF